MALGALLRRTTWLDRVVVAVLLVGCLASFALVGRGAKGARLVVERQGRVIFTAPLSGDQSVALQGPLGATLLAIREGKVCILDSPCPNKVCIGMGEVARSGELLACVPNQLVVRIEGEETAREQGYDLLSR